jgi:hypothetical protein
MMIDPSFDGEVATITPYPPTMQDLEKKVVDLQSQLQFMENDRNFWQEKAHERMAMIDNLEQYVKENFDYIDENVSQELVDIFGLEISKDYDVEVTVRFTGTVSAPLNFDMDDLENALDARLDFSYYHDGTGDFSEDSMEIDWSES